MKKTKQSLPPLATTMGHRASWLWEFVKLRNYNFDSNNHRNTFLYIYYLTVKQAFDSKNCARGLTNQRNRQLNKRLNPTELYKKYDLWDLPKNNRIFKNEKIIELLGITQSEVKTLKIFKVKEEKEERARRRIAREDRNDEIILLSAKGWTQKNIATHLDISISTVKRILRKNREFFIQGSDFTINRKTKEKNASTKLFISQDAERLYSIYKTEKDNAPEDEYQLALEKLKNTDSNIFIQGLAGTGKSFLIKEYLESLSKSERSNVLLVAPTGKAADVIGGVTIHNAFELQPTLQLPDEITTIPKMLRNINTLIVDEISMVRIDLFDKMMQILELAESKGQKIRLIFVGDIGQIGPTISKSDTEMLKILYPGIKGYYAFNSDKWADANFEKIILYKIKRQKDAELIEHLNGIRFGRIEDINWFNINVSPFASANPIYICSRRNTVDEFNRSAIEEYKKDHILFTYDAIYDGSLPETLPCPERLSIGVGVRVMTICNNKNYKNGMVGTVKSLDDTKVVIRFDNGKTATLKRQTFTLENGTQYTQFPLILAYAITIHRAQGSTYEHVVLICDGMFQANMLYTALSRCTSLENLSFIGELTEKDLIVDTESLKMTIYNN